MLIVRKKRLTKEKKTGGESIKRTTTAAARKTKRKMNMKADMIGNSVDIGIWTSKIKCEHKPQTVLENRDFEVETEFSRAKRAKLM